MINSNAKTAEPSVASRARELLELGDLAGALEHYCRLFDPDAMDETEARNALIEARSHLTVKQIVEALESFEEAIMMGTDVQRRQALEGISTIAEIKGRLKGINQNLKKSLEKHFPSTPPESMGLAMTGEDENVIVLSGEALQLLPENLAKSNRLRKPPLRLMDLRLAFRPEKCILYVDEEDVKFVEEIFSALARGDAPKNQN